jgi:hypothetical protein
MFADIWGIYLLRLEESCKTSGNFSVKERSIWNIMFNAFVLQIKGKFSIVGSVYE